MITPLISKMAEVRHGSSTSDGPASGMSDKAIIDFLLESDSDLSSLSEESSDEEDENDISIDSETEEDIILEDEEHEDIVIDDINEETSKALDAYHQTVEKDTRNTPANLVWPFLKTYFSFLMFEIKIFWKPASRKSLGSMI